MKRIFSLILSLCLLFSISGQAVAAENLADESNGSGIKMDVGSFVRNYTGEGSGAGQMPMMASLNQNESICYNNFSYDVATRSLVFDAIISDGASEYPITVTGVLYNSWKQDYGINSIVGEMSVDDESFEVLSFEIYNDDDPALVNETFLPGSNQGEILKFYLKKGETLYLFETAIPEALVTISIPDIPANRCTDSKVDGFWFQDIVTPQMGVSGGFNPGISVQSTEDDKSALLSATWTIAGVPYIYYARVIMYYHFSDVDDNSGDWRLELSVDDAYCRVNGERNELTGLRITNIDMRMVTGPYTKMLNVVPGFQLFDSSSVTGNATTVKGLLSVCSAISGNVATSLATTAIDWLIDATQESNSLTENTVFYLPNSRDSAEGRTFGYHVPSRYFMQHVGDYVGFDLRTRSSSFGLSSASGGTKTGLCEIEFDYYVGETTRHYSGFTGVQGTYRCTLA